MATSLISMLNRLPIYSRPKEPAIGIIGNPVLVETSNASLATLPTIPVQPKYDHFGKLVLPPASNQKHNTWKKLPPLPGQSSEPPPVKYTPFSIPSPQSSNTPARRTPSPPAPANSGSSRPALIQRKPAPTPAYHDELSGDNSAREPFHQSHDSQTMGNAGICRTISSGKAKAVQVRTAPLIAPATMTSNSRGLAKHRSIDDWVSKMEQPPPTPLKIEGRTSPPRTPQRRVASASVEPPKLAIRQSVFAPLGDSPLSQDVPSSPPIRSKSGLKVVPWPPPSQTKIPKPVDAPSQTPRRFESVGGVLIKPRSDSLNFKIGVSDPLESESKDHIEELEGIRERLISRRISTNQQIYELQQSLSELTFTSPGRLELKERLLQKKQELADIEKEIFDTGMLIHRAWKRKVKKDGVEGPTHLWIHNVAAKE